MTAQWYSTADIRANIHENYTLNFPTRRNLFEEVNEVCPKVKIWMGEMEQKYGASNITFFLDEVEYYPDLGTKRLRYACRDKGVL